MTITDCLPSGGQLDVRDVNVASKEIHDKEECETDLERTANGEALDDIDTTFQRLRTRMK